MILFTLDDSITLIRRVPENSKVSPVWHILPLNKEQTTFCRMLFPAYDLVEKCSPSEIKDGDKFCAFCFPKHFVRTEVMYSEMDDEIYPK